MKKTTTFLKTRVKYGLLTLMGLVGLLTAKAQVDIGAIAINNPVAPFCTGSNNVSVVITNFGADTITSATISWTVNGFAQIDVNYSDTLATNETDTLLLGTIAFDPINSFDISAFTSLPNGLPDVDNSNDTVSVIGLQTQLSGTFTISGAGADYATLTDAVGDLAARGVCGPVVFNLRDGVYSEQLLIDPIPGASLTNTITFQSENLDSSLVTIALPSSNLAANNYLVRLNGASFITFHKITFERSGSNAFARIIDYTANASYNTISNCRVIGSTSTVTISSAALIYSSASTLFNDSMNVFTNNIFSNGSLGIYMNGVSPAALENNIVITNNIFENQTSKAIQLSNQAQAIISNNTVRSVAVFNNFSAIYCNLCQQNMVITNNKIEGVTGTALYLIDCTGLAGIRSLVANNFITSLDSTGINITGGDYQDVLHNSINVAGTNAASTAIKYAGIMTGMNVRNNVLANNAGGYAYVITNDAASGIVISNTNNLYTTGANIGQYSGTDAASLSDWTTLSAQDNFSVSTNPTFASAIDLHSNSIVMNNAGLPLASVTTDIDGETRSNTPDIGADEYTPLLHDVGVSAILSPVNGACEDSVASITLIITNSGDYAETNFDFTVDVTGDFTLTATETYTDILAPGISDTITLTATLNTSSGGNATLTAYTLLLNENNLNNDTTILTFNINANPVAPLAQGDTACGSGSLTLVALLVDSLAWYDTPVGGSAIAGGISFSTPIINNTTSYFVEEISAFGCKSTRTEVIAVINSLPIVDLGPDVSFVSGGNAILDPGPGYISYSWTTGDTAQSITISTGGNYCVTVTDANGCANQDCIDVNEVFPLDAGIESLLSPNVTCEQDSLQITVVIRNYGTFSLQDVPVVLNVSGDATLNINDTLTGTLLAGASAQLTFDVLLDATGGATYSFEVYTSLATDEDNGNDTLKESKTILPYAATPTGLAGSRCGEGFITLTAASNDSICWYDAPIGGNQLGCGSSYTAFFDSTTTIYAEAGTTCPSLSRATVQAIVLGLPVINLGNDTIVPVGLPYTLDAGAGFIFYSWSTLETTQTINVLASNTYSVTVTDSNGCSASDSILVTFNVGIGAPGKSGIVSLYPNPSAGLVQIMTGNQEDALTLSVTNALGQKVYTTLLPSVKASHDLDLRNFAKGIYFLELRNKNLKETLQLIIQ
ncbi:MAG: hypothetical protein RIQ89_2360 [Bacteroidota bacterium]|jgi:hypothetical protein